MFEKEINPDQEDVKPSSTTIQINVLDPEGNPTLFTINRNTKFSQVISKYCARVNIIRSRLRFHVDGQAIGENQTPDDLEMEDGDCIEIQLEQTSGGYRRNHD